MPLYKSEAQLKKELEERRLAQKAVREKFTEQGSTKAYEELKKQVGQRKADDLMFTETSRMRLPTEGSGVKAWLRRKTGW